MKKYKISYRKPTPVLFRKLGDAFLTASTAAGGYAIATDNDKVGLWIFIFGVAGKFLTSFFAEDTPQ